MPRADIETTTDPFEQSRCRGALETAGRTSRVGADMIRLIDAVDAMEQRLRAEGYGSDRIMGPLRDGVSDTWDLIDSALARGDA